MRISLSTPALFIACLCSAQIAIDRRVELTGPTGTSRQVLGLDTTLNAAAALTAAVEQRGEHRHGSAGGGAIWSVLIEALSAPEAGTHITIAAPAGSPAGDALLQVNGDSPVPILWAPGVPLDAASVTGGDVLSLVHNGTAWQVMNGAADRLRTCPPEMSAVNGQFCIERAQRSSLAMADAVAVCAAQGKRLCTWGEFVAACQRRTDLGLLNPSSDWEWTGNSANEENNVRMTKLSNCTMAGHRLMTGPAAPYRCCLTR